MCSCRLVLSYHLFSSLLYFYYLFHDPIRKDFGLTFIFLYLQDAALLRREFPQHDLFGTQFLNPQSISDSRRPRSSKGGGSTAGCDPEGDPCGLRPSVYRHRCGKDWPRGQRLLDVAHGLFHAAHGEEDGCAGEYGK
jgi:hypothetical protein